MALSEARYSDSTFGIANAPTVGRIRVKAAREDSNATKFELETAGISSTYWFTEFQPKKI